MTLINPAILAFVIALLGLDLAAIAWGADSRPSLGDDRGAERQA